MSGMIQKPSGALRIHHSFSSARRTPKIWTQKLLHHATGISMAATNLTKIGVDRVQLRDLGANLEQRGVLPSGKRLHSYWKLSFIVDLPIKNAGFP